MQKRIRELKGLIFGISAIFLLASCNLYPKFEGWKLVMEIEAGRDGAPAGRMLAQDMKTVVVELRQGGFLKALGSGILQAVQPGDTFKASVEIAGVTEGHYQVLAYALNPDGIRRQTASAQIQFTPSASPSVVNLRLIPDETTPGTVIPLTVGEVSGTVTLLRGTTSFVKLAVPEVMDLWLDTAADVTLSYQNLDGSKINSLAAQGTPVQPGSYYIYYYYSGAAPSLNTAFYADTYDSLGVALDRRGLKSRVVSAEALLAEAQGPGGFGAGDFPVVKTSIQNELDGLTAALTTAKALLPPNYDIADAGALPAAETGLTTAMAALEAKRLTGTDGNIEITISLVNPLVPVVNAVKSDGSALPLPLTVGASQTLSLKVTGQTVDYWYLDGDTSVSLGAGDLVLNLALTPLSPGNHSLTYVYTANGALYTENLSFTVEAP